MLVGQKSRLLAVTSCQNSYMSEYGHVGKSRVLFKVMLIIRYWIGDISVFN